MLPTKVMQLDYQDFSQIVWENIANIIQYEIDNKIKFNAVLGKLRNGCLAASIVANQLQITMGVYYAPRKDLGYPVEFFLPQEVEIKIKAGEVVHILFVDSICGTGQTILEAKKLIADKYGKNVVLHTYCTLCDSRSQNLVDIHGLVSELFFQPPWEWRANTPSTHLDRLMTGNIKGSSENTYMLGYSSQKCKDDFLMSLAKEVKVTWEVVFDLLDIQRQLQSSSGVSSLEVPDNLTFEEARGRFSLLLDEKEEFIKANGLTHYIENDCVQAILLAQRCPVAHIFYFDGQELNKIYSKNVNRLNLISSMN